MNTNTYDALLKLYRGDAAALQADIADHVRTGYIFVSPEYFLMGKRIDAGWHIYAAVGTGAIEGFCDFMPYYLPYIGWERRGGKTRWYQTDKLLTKLGYDPETFKRRIHERNTARHYRFAEVQLQRGSEARSHTSTQAAVS